MTWLHIGVDNKASHGNDKYKIITACLSLNTDSNKSKPWREISYLNKEQWMVINS